MEKTLLIRGDDFAHGLMTAKPSHILPYGACEYVRNFDFSRKSGCLKKRRGTANYLTSLGAGAVCGLFQFVKTDGSKWDIMAAGSTVYSVTGGVATARHAGAMAGARVRFAMLQNRLIMVGATESTMKWDGITANFQLLLGSPPANGKYICVWQNRVWIANHAAGKSRVNYCADGNSEDWTTAGAAGYIDVNIDDGDEITGLLPVGTSLYIFKNRSVYRITGTKPDNYVPFPVILNRGCVAPDSIVSMGNFIVYMSQYGLHSIAGDVDGFLSRDIQFDIENLSNAAKLIAAGGKQNNNYYLAFDSDADGKNDSAYVLDMLEGSWTYYSPFKAAVLMTQDNGNLISGASDVIKLRQHETGEDDEGVAIDAIWRSSKIGFDDFTSMKRMQDTFWSAVPLSGKTLTTRLRVDGVQVDEVSTSLTAHQISAVDEDIKVIGSDGVATSEGRYVQIEFRNNELNAPVEVSEISFRCEFKERLQTPT